MTDWQKGIQAFREGRLREAADRLTAASVEEELTVSQAARFETYAHLGAAFYALGRPDEAVTAFEKAIQLSPTSTPPDELTLNLVHAYLAAGRREAGREALHYLLHHSPGHVAARMLLQRLDHAPPDKPVSGSIMGVSAESVKQYLHTLSFDVVERSGYDPTEVREALLQIATYVEALDRSIQGYQETISQYQAEIQRYRQMEDAMVQNMLQMQQDAQAPSLVSETANLSPVEILFQKKP